MHTFVLIDIRRVCQRDQFRIGRRNVHICQRRVAYISQSNFHLLYLAAEHLGRQFSEEHL